MEDLVGIVIYVILAIVGVLAGVYRNKQKRDQAASKHTRAGIIDTQPATSVDTDYDPFSGLFEEEQEEEYLADEQDKTGKTYLAHAEDLEAAEDYPKEHDEGKAMFKETEEVILSDNITGNDKSIYTETEVPLCEEIDDHIKDKIEFDLREAIIYSEIINRKEF